MPDDCVSLSWLAFWTVTGMQKTDEFEWNHEVVCRALSWSQGDLSQFVWAGPNESFGGRERQAFDLFVSAAPWELAEINALFSWRNEWLCLTSFVKLQGIHCLCLLTAERGHMGWNGPSCENQAQGKLDLNLTQRNLEIHPKGAGSFSCLRQNDLSLGLVCNEQWRLCHNYAISRNMVCIMNDGKQKSIQHLPPPPRLFLKHRHKDKCEPGYNQVMPFFMLGEA